MTTYLISQATGQQSQWVITQLLQSNATIHAVVRDPTKDLPSVLKHPNVTVFKGDSTDYDSILAAAKGCTGVFINTFPIPGVEAQQAKTIAEASRAAGIETAVLTTTMFTAQKDKWDTDEVKEIGLHAYFVSKAAAEDAVRGAGFKALTILRPGFIHFDYFTPSVFGNFPTLTTHHRIDHMYDEGARMPHTDGLDIGTYAAAALQNPDKFGGEEIDLINECLTVGEMRDTLVKVSGKEIVARRIPAEEEEEALKGVFALRFHQWANFVEIGDGKAEAREKEAKYGIPFHSLEETLTREKGRLLSTLGL